jgi:AcrR family transcriptional regulator
MKHAIKPVDHMIKTARGEARRPARRNREITEDTRTRILDAAERLFAEKGVDAISVRAVLKEAGVNVALAHYHFGSREGLIEELLRTRVAPLAEEQIRDIVEVDARGADATLEDVLRAYFGGAFRARPNLAKLLAQLQLAANPALREMGRDAMRKAIYRLGEALMRRMASPAEPERLLLRLFLVFMAPAQLTAQWEVVQQSARKRFPDRLPTPAQAAEELVAFCAAGLRAGPAGTGAALEERERSPR